MIWMASVVTIVVALMIIIVKIEPERQEPEPEQVYENVWIREHNGQALVYFVDKEQEYVIDAGDLSRVKNHLADIQVQDGRITKVSIKKEEISGRVLEVSRERIEIEGYGKLPIAEGFQAFQMLDDFVRLSLRDILVGYDNWRFIVARGEVCAAYRMQSCKVRNIRVLLTDSSMKDTLHAEVSMLPESQVTLFYGKDGKEQEILPAEEALTIRADDRRLREGRMILDAGDSTITVTSIAREQGNPSYLGRLELEARDGRLTIVNDVPIEEYLRRVVPSEMPASYQLEALKAQAVCARTYAYNNILSNSLKEYGAHVDDTVSYQVYNNIRMDGKSDEAVRETAGEILTYKDQPAMVYYFSTSCGVTTDTAVWGMEPEKTPYLHSVGLRDGGSVPELGTKSAFAEFIKTTEYSSYDGGFAFYRWNTRISASLLTEKWKDSEVGTVQKVAVTKRGTGGIAEQVEVTGSKGSVTWNLESQIRQKLGDPSLQIECLDGRTVDGWSSLPSAYILIESGEADEAGNPTFVIYGGGYGHGVGMSQNGAQGMAKNGMDYKNILNFFYNGTSLSQ